MAMVPVTVEEREAAWLVSLPGLSDLSVLQAPEAVDSRRLAVTAEEPHPPALEEEASEVMAGAAVACSAGPEARCSLVDP